jgi:hypothetical protein
MLVRGEWTIAIAYAVSSVAGSILALILGVAMVRLVA